MRLILRTFTMLLTGPALSLAVHLSPPAENAFKSYIENVEARLGGQRSSPAPVLRGNLPIEPVNGGSWVVNGGLLHHWRGAAFVPGVSPGDMLKLLRDYQHLSRFYAPEVISSRAETDRGEKATLAMRFKKRQVITIVLDAEFETESGLDGSSRGHSFSRSTHIWQVDQPGTAPARGRG